MKKGTIICVDDEKFALIALRSQLNLHFENEFLIETTESGEEALEVIDELMEQKMDLVLIITDQIMPGMKGDKLLKIVHERLPKTLKILFTGQADATAVGNAVNQAKLYRYIAKPWEETDLVLTVKEAVRSYFQDKKLEEKNKELKELNRTLEHKVKERTAEVIKQKEKIQGQAEKLKLANEELTTLNATKDKLFSIIAHDLKNPFNIIIGYSSLLIEGLDEMDRKEIGEIIEHIHNSSNNAHELLQNLLEWSISQIDRIKCSPKNIYLSSLVEKNIDLHFNIAKSKNINLVNHILNDITVFADEEMISTVFRNLISNAIKFTNSGGEVNISSNSKNGFIEIIVADNGVGIAKKDIAKLFRLDVSYTTIGTAKEKGTGLGLILCKEFVNQNGGEISVESEPGNLPAGKAGGTKFIFTLPVKND